MYPVLSLLRRTAASIILATPEMLERQPNGEMHVRLETKSQTIDRETGKWGKTTDVFVVRESSIIGRDSAEAAIGMAKYENLLAEKFNASDSLYTLVFGPEAEEKRPDGRVQRRSRYAIIRGVYRASAGVIRTVPQQGRQVIRFRELPPGVVHEG